jgi:hypothetical protein
MAAVLAGASAQAQLNYAIAALWGCPKSNCGRSLTLPNVSTSRGQPDVGVIRLDLANKLAKDGMVEQIYAHRKTFKDMTDFFGRIVQAPVMPNSFQNRIRRRLSRVLGGNYSCIA